MKSRLGEYALSGLFAAAILCYIWIIAFSIME